MDGGRLETEGVSTDDTDDTVGGGGDARRTGRDGSGGRTGLGDQVPFLARLEAHDRAALLALGRRLRFARRDSLLRQHEPSTHVLFVLRGWTKVSSEAANGYEALLALRGPGDIVGEAAALSNRPRSATVRALGEVEAVAVDQERFTSFLAATPQVALRLLALTTDRMRDSDSRRLQFAALSVRERLAMLLLELARTHGEHTDEGIRLTSGLSQYELAGSVGASREAVARLLRELRQRGIVRTGRRGLVLIRPEQLRRMRRTN